jgi:amino acid transporter
MKIKWKCVWKVLKPKIIAALIVILSIIVISSIIFLIGSYWISTIPPLDFTNMTPAQQQQIIGTSCGGCGFSVSALVAFLLVIIGGIGIVVLGIELIKSLAEELKPCIIWEKK